MKRRVIRRVLSILMAFAVIFTGVPALTGTAGAHAASSYWKNVNVSATGQTKVTVSWKKLTKKQQKKIHGITVFRNGVAVKNLKKNATSFTDTGLKAGTRYTYQIKTNKKKTKKVKMWYNKATKQYQKSKPAKKYRGKRKTFKKVSYKYKNASPARSATTKAQTSPGKGTQSTGGSDGGNPTTPAVTTETKTVTDYMGVQRTITKQQDSAGYYWLDNNGKIADDTPNGLAKWDKTQDGEFTVSGGYVMIQKNGVTFNKTLLQNPDHLTDRDRDPYVEMYSGDFDKLTFEVQDLKPVVTHDKDKNQITEYYVIKDGKRLAKFEEYFQETGKAGDSKVQKKGIAFRGKMWQLCDGCGFVSGNVIIDVKYNGEKLATWSLPVNTDADEEGLSPFRRNCIDFAMQAFGTAGPSGDYNADMEAVERHIRTVPYGHKVGTGDDAVYMTCTGGRSVLETFSIYQYGVYGFDSWGQYKTEAGAIAAGASGHSAFHLDSNPNKYYEADGYHQ